jgi:hypothetical protein
MLQKARLKEVDETSVSTNLQNGLVDGRLNSSATRRKQAEKPPSATSLARNCDAHNNSGANVKAPRLRVRE